MSINKQLRRNSKRMNIQSAAQASDLPVKTVRYYDDIGLVTPGRAENGYRAYGDDDVHKLRFLGRARSLGFSLDDCRQLLSLYEDRNRASADVKALTMARIDDVDRKIAELKSLRKTLNDLAKSCHGDDRPDCPIIDGLAK